MGRLASRCEICVYANELLYNVHRIAWRIVVGGGPEKSRGRDAVGFDRFCGTMECALGFFFCSCDRFLIR